MIESLTSMVLFIVPFIAVITVVVFFHELGHFLVARWNGVRIETFSIGFGGEIFGWNDRHGTRWRLSWIPLGGYVKFFGDAGATSATGEDLDQMTDDERAVSFHHKSLLQRAAVVVAGPVANFILAIVIFAVLFMTAGQRVSDPLVVEVFPDTAAAAAGLQAGDTITAIDGAPIERFQDIPGYVQPRPGEALELQVLRDGRQFALTVTPTPTEREVFGTTQTIGVLGVRGPDGLRERLGPFAAVGAGVGSTYNIIVTTLDYLADVIIGRVSADQLAGPIGIATMASEVAQTSIVALISFAAIISVALGLFNLFPIPLLDGGHLLFYAIEALRGKALSERAQEIGFRLGIAAVLVILARATFNDLGRTNLFGFIGGLFG